MKINNKIHVGTYGTPVGLKGEIKINLFNFDFKVFKDLKNYTNYESSIKWVFKKMYMRNNKCIALPDKFKTRDDAQMLKGIRIFTEEVNLPTNIQNKYSYYNLINFNIYLSNRNLIGEVLSVHNFGAGHLLETNFRNKNIFIPMNEENLIFIDHNNKEIIVRPIKGILD